MTLARARLVALGAVLVVACAAWLIPVSVATFGRDGRVIESSEAVRARHAAERLGAPPVDLVLTVTGDERIGRTAVRAAQIVSAALSRESGVRAVWSGATRDQSALRSRDGAAVLVLVRLSGSVHEREATADRLVERARDVVPAATVEAGGPSWTLERVDSRIEHDLLRAELLAAPVVFVLLLITYGSFVSALMPVLVAGVAVLCTIPLLGGMARLVDISAFAVNAALAIGFGLAVDYTLFLLARYREELADGLTRVEALAVAVRTSGRSVLFSAAAVMVCLAAVTVIPVPLVRALALAGVTVTLLSATVALLLTPACVVLLGPLCERGDPFHRWRSTKLGQGSPFWRRAAQVVTRRWAVAGGVVVVLLGMMAWPFAHARLGIMDHRVMPASSPVASVGERVRAEFVGAPEQVVTVVLSQPTSAARLAGYEHALAAVQGVNGVRVAAGSPGAGTVLAATTTVRVGSSSAAALVEGIRAVPAPGPVMVGGRAAEVEDTLAAARRALPWAVALLSVGLALLLALFTRSVVAPLKALVVAVVSLGASLGALVAVFQDGTARSVLGGFTVTGTLDISLLLFTLAIALALSVDYEVFLLGRIREEYQRSADNPAAVVEGIARTGRLMTSAALAVAFSTSAMVTSSVSVIKMIGAGVALAALVDAVLVRGVLVPAVMAALGPANWWLPSARRRPGLSAPPEAA
ncbi:MMPL family transporter [Streptomyces sp. HNM0663]|uniref:MMPL family transporter n=1 Tax=Streptomyces chengmaiensis TaxID=3040919 RepID=A0ABT6HID1_9ACTN|nr:MMPL family transporter [Streptomyces chengmaiensis]MDH2388513.1 MMPL family transporter [Streptomyces chengmaiensis]